MRKITLILSSFIVLTCLAILPVQNQAAQQNNLRSDAQMPIWLGYQTNLSDFGNDITVYVTYNPGTGQILDVTAQNNQGQFLTIVDYHGTITPVSGILHATNFVVELSGGDAVTLNGALTMV